MITPGDPNPSLPAPGTQVCIPFTTAGGGTPTGTVTHANGTTLSPNVTLAPHPANTYVICFTWPPGNTTSDVTIVAGGESITFSVAGTGGP